MIGLIVIVSMLIIISNLFAIPCTLGTGDRFADVFNLKKYKTIGDIVYLVINFVGIMIGCLMNVRIRR